MGFVPKGALPESKLIAGYWPLLEVEDGTARIRYDNGRGGYDLTDNNTTASSRAVGLQLQGADLQSANSESLTRAGDATFLDFGATSFSIWCLVNRRSDLAAEAVLFGANDTGTNDGYSFKFNASEQLSYRPGPGSASASALTVKTADGVTGCGMAYDGTNVFFYKNTSANSAVSATNPGGLNAAADMAIGKLGAGALWFQNAGIKFMIVWSSAALSAGQIGQLTKAFAGPELLNASCG